MTLRQITSLRNIVTSRHQNFLDRYTRNHRSYLAEQAVSKSAKSEAATAENLVKEGSQNEMEAHIRAMEATPVRQRCQMKKVFVQDLHRRIW